MECSVKISNEKAHDNFMSNLNSEIIISAKFRIYCLSAISRGLV
jgi:hypothetical protein